MLQKNKREAHTGIAFLSSAGTVKLQHLFRYINPCSTLLPINSAILSCRGMESAAKSEHGATPIWVNIWKTFIAQVIFVGN